MAAGSLCGIVITRLLIGSAADEENTPAVTSLSAAAAAAAAALSNCSLSGSSGCITAHSPPSSFDATTRISTRAATTGSLVDVLVSQVHIAAISPA